jgi:hypothetical protein
MHKAKGVGNGGLTMSTHLHSQLNQDLENEREEHPPGMLGEDYWGDWCLTNQKLVST